jgi:hypothetical protein
MFYLTEENVSPASRTTGVSQLIYRFKLRRIVFAFTSIKLQVYKQTYALQRC